MQGKQRRRLWAALLAFLCAAALILGVLGAAELGVARTARADGTGVTVVTEDGGETNYTTLTEAITAVSTDAGEENPKSAKMTLNADLTEAVTIPYGLEIELDLNGHTLTGAESTAVTVNGSLTLEDSDEGGAGLITTSSYAVTVNQTGTLVMNGGTVVADYGLNINGGTVTVNDGTVGSKEGETTAYGVYIHDDGVITVNGGLIQAYGFGISGNNTHAGENGTTITVADGEVYGAEMGIYHPQYGTLTITGGYIHGAAGIEMREGSLYVSGGTIVAEGEFSEWDSSNGNSVEGVALSVSVYEKNDHDQDLTVTIEGGTFIATGTTGYAFYEAVDLSGHTDHKVGEYNQSVVIDISGGTFIGSVGSVNCEEFISGGTFTDDTLSTAYVKSGATVTAASCVTTAEELATALAAGGTIILGADISLSSTLTIAAGTTVVLELNGYSVTAENTWAVQLYGDLTVQDSSYNRTGKIAGTTRGVNIEIADGNTSTGDNTSTDRSTGVLTLLSGTIEATAKGGAAIRNVGGIVTIEGGTVLASGESGYGVSVFCNASLYVHGGTITAGNSTDDESYGISGNNTKAGLYGTTIEITGGEVYGAGMGIYHPQYGTLTITGGYIHGGAGIEMREGSIYVSGDAVIEAEGTFREWDSSNGGSMEGVALGISVYETGDHGQNLVVVITGGEFIAPEGGYAILEAVDLSGHDDHEIGDYEHKVVISISGNVTLSGQVLTYNNADDIADSGIFGASLYGTDKSNVFYTSLAEAIAAATSGDTVVLYSDAEGTFEIDGKDITIDLNGYTITGALYYDEYVSAFEIYGSAKLTVTDSSEDNSGLITTATSGDYYAYTVNVYDGDFVLESGTIASDYVALYLDDSYGDGIGSATINGGKVGVENTPYAICVWSGTLTVNGGTIIATDLAVDLHDTTAYAEINGGTISSSATAVQITYGGSAEINGGTIGGEDTAYAVFVSYGGSLAVTGGTITASVYGISGNNTQAGTEGTTIEISGGEISGGAAGIYNPQIGTLTISGGDISGQTGIEVREGTVTIEGGTITSTAENFNVTDSSNGMSIYGAALAVSVYGLNDSGTTLSVTITGGTFIASDGCYAVYEDYVLISATPDVTMEISGGDFTGGIYSENCTSFIAGGTYTSLPDYTYFAEDCAPAQLADGTYGVAEGSLIVISEIEINNALTPDENNTYSTAYTGEPVYLFSESKPISATKGTGYTIIDDDGYTDAGTYEIYLVLSDGCAWVDAEGTISFETMLTFTLVIEKATATAPTVASGWTGSEYAYTADYTGSDIAFFDGTEFVGYTVSLTGATDAETYYVTVTLDSNHTWDDNSESVLTYTFTIEPAKATITINSAFTKGSDSYTYTAAYETVFTSVESVTFITGEGFTLYGTNTATEAGRYIVVVILSDNYAWADGTTDSVLTFTFVIESAAPEKDTEVAMPTADSTTYAYTGEEQTFKFNETLNEDAYTVYGGTHTDAGNYTVYVILNSGYQWESADEGYEHAVLTFEFTIEKATVTPPTPVEGWDGSGYEWSATLTTEGASLGFFTETGTGIYTVTGPENADATGTYYVTLVLCDPDNYCWSDETYTDSIYITYTFTLTISVAAETATAPTIDLGVWTEGDGNTYTADYAELFTDTDEITFITADTGYTVHGDTTATGAGTYTVTLILEEGYAWEDGSTDPVTYTFVIEKSVVEAPTGITETYTYDGQEITFIENGELYTAAGDVKGTNAGVYVVILVLNDPDNYRWADEATTTYTFTINKAEVTAPEVTSTWTDGGSGTYTYTWTNNDETVDFFEECTESGLYTLTGGTAATGAGTYYVTLVLNDPDNYAWAGSDEAFLSYTFVVESETAKTAEFTADKINNSFTYDGATGTYTADYADLFTAGVYEITLIEPDEGYTVYNGTATTVGTYVVVVVLDEGYAWDEETGFEGSVLTFTFTITSDEENLDKQIEKPDFEATLTYDGTEQTFITGTAAGYTVYGTTSGTDAGEYTVYVVLNSGYRWIIEEDDTDTDEYAVLTYVFTIEKAEATAPTVDTTAWGDSNYSTTYTGSEIAFFTDEKFEGYTVSLTSATDAGTYTVTVTLDSNHKWTDGSDTALTYTFTITKAVVETPAVANGWAGDGYEWSAEYTGDELSFFADAEGYTVSLESATDAGTYTVIVTLDSNHTWADGNETALTYTFTIEKAAVAVPGINNLYDFTYDESTGIYTALYGDLFDGNSSYTFLTDAGDGLYTIYGNTVEVIEGESMVGTYRVYVILSDTSNYCWEDGGDAALEFVFKIVTREGLITSPSSFITKTTVEWEETITFVTLTDKIQKEYDGRVEIYNNTISGVGVEDGDTFLVTFHLLDPENDAWSDLTTGDKTYVFTVIVYGNKIAVIMPDEATTVFVYETDDEGNAVAQTYPVAESDVYEVIGNVQSEAGTYTVAIVLYRPDLYAWADKDGNIIYDDDGNDLGAVLLYTFEIRKQEVSAPEGLRTGYTYTGETITFITDGDLYAVVGDGTGTDAGKYFVTLELIDPDNYAWADGSAPMYTFEIGRAEVTAPDVAGTSFTYTGEAITFMTDGDLYAVEGATSGTNVGQYVVTLVLSDPANYEWAEGTTTTYTFTIEKAKVTAPDAGALTYTYTYSGEEITFIETDSDYYTAQGAMKGTHAGEYVVTLVLNDPANYEWADGATTTFTFTIEKASNSVTDPRISSSGYGIGSVAEFGTIIYKYYLDADCTEEVTSIVKSGTYYVRAEVEETENYAGAVSGAVEFEVEEDSSVTWADIVGLSSSLLLLIVLIIVMIVIIRRKNNA